jgi:hypothetical protein
MAKMTKTQIDKAVRDAVFDMLFMDNPFAEHFHKINDRQFGVIISAPPDGTHRYVRIPAIVAELRDDMTAEELMQSEIDAYNQKQADKAEKQAKKEKQIAKDKARREAEAKAKEEQANA